jgi:hypothetical protein
MNNKATYWIVGIIVIVVIVILVASSGKSTTPASTSGSESTASTSSSASDQSVQVNQTNASAARQTMHDLIASGATETCTFSIPATASTSSLSGTVYIASGDMRGDFVRTDTSNKVVKAHMIISKGMTYLWSDALSKGIKMLWSVAASSSAMLGKVGGLDVNQPTAYSCTSQTPAQSLFTLPANTAFTDVTAYMKAAR